MSLNLGARHSDFTLTMTFIISLFAGIILTFYGNDTLNQYRKQKTLCEETLPRNQVCEMKFVPKED